MPPADDGSPAARRRRALPALLGGRSLASRIVGLSLLLLLLVQLAGFAVVRSNIDTNARAQLAAELQIGDRVWRRLLDSHAQRLRQGAQLLSSDFGFRAAVASEDVETIRSALDNQGARIGADVAAFLGTDLEARAVHANEGNLQTMPALMRGITQSLALNGGSSRIALLDGRPFIWVAVPLRAPVTLGWVVMGFPLGQALVDDMRALSALNVTVVASPRGAAPHLIATTLGDAGRALAVMGPVADGSLMIGGDESHVRVVAQEGTGGDMRTVLSRPVAEVAEPFRRVQAVLAAITALGVLLFGLGSAWTAQRVTGPLRDLVDASDRLGRGDYDTALAGTQRADEIGDLSRAFELMRQRIAVHAVELNRLAYTDRLTGMPNRARFRQALQAAIAAAARPSGAGGPPDTTTVAVLMLDLDRFKHVNDVLGYAIGDRLLCAVAARLTTVVLRDGDLVACLGGDKFALLLPDTSAAHAEGIAQRIVTSFEQPLTLGEHTVDLSAGIGIACWPADADAADGAHGAESLLVHAEVAMYGAKRRRDALCRYHPALDSTSMQSLSLLSELRRAVEDNELRLYLQPKVALDSRRLVGAEALVRWQHPTRGLVPPMEFIPFAEQTGFVRQLTLWVLEDAARQWPALQALGPLKLSVNLSTRDLMDLDLPNKLDAILRRHGASEQGFCLEITESAIMDDPQRAESTLNAFHDRGYTLSIDDFGTGYSSLAYLRRLPVAELKIDRSFVMAMERSPDDEKIVRSTIELAHNLGLSVVAEGIENAAVLGQLATLKCDQGQGYHMARPLPVAEFLAWGARWNAEHPPADRPAVERHAVALH